MVLCDQFALRNWSRILRAVLAGRLRPFLDQLLADLLQLRHQLGARLAHLHSLRLEGFEELAGFFGLKLPAALLGRLGCGEDRILRLLIEAAEDAFIGDRDVPGRHRLDLVEVLHEVPCLGIDARRRRGDHRLDDAGREGLRHFGLLHGHRYRAHELGKPPGDGVEGAELHALEVGGRFDLLAGIERVRRPRHYEQEAHSLPLQTLLQDRAHHLEQLLALLVVRREERHRVDAEERALVRMHRHQELADLHLSGLDRALHLGLLGQRVLRMNDDLDLAVGCLLHVLGELHDVAREVVPLVGAHRHVPFVGERRGTREERGGEAAGGGEPFESGIHVFLRRVFGSCCGCYGLCLIRGRS